MSTDEYSTEMELYGVSPGVIRVMIYFVTILAPFGFIPSSSNPLGLFWIQGGFYGLLLVLVNPFFYLPLCFLNVLYARRIVLYYQARVSKNSVFLVGLFSILLPTTIFLYLTGLFGSYVVIYPIPIQFIAGWILLHRIEGPEVISPWSGMRLDLSWWRFGKPRKTSDWEPFEDEKKKAKTRDWLEG
ncbi:MAG: hypothetical protein ACFFEL_02000 [Candidatus Thorarchaeota archaeon]